MVAVATPIWATTNARDDRLGDFESFGQFVEWAAEVGFGEVVILPIHTHIMDVRLHALRHLLTDFEASESLAGVWKKAVDKIFDLAPARSVVEDEFVSSLSIPVLPISFQFERCPYYSSSAFAISPLWCGLSAQTHTAQSVVEYFHGLHDGCSTLEYGSSPSSLCKLTGEDCKRNCYLWAETWFNKTLALLDGFNEEGIESKYRKIITEIAAAGSSYEFKPLEGDGFLLWVESNWPWAFPFALWETLADASADAQVSSALPDKRVWQSTPSWTKWDLPSLLPGADPSVHYSTPLLLRVLREETHLARGFLFSLWSQCRIQQDWEEKLKLRRVEIIGDIPIYVPTASADVWANPTVFGIEPSTLRPRMVSGLPPDYWSSEGQFWGTPTYDWRLALEPRKTWSAECAQYWIRRLDRQLKLFDRVRIDHYRAFADYWAIPVDPEGGARSSAAGRWLEGPGSGMLREVMDCLGVCSTRIIVEDLGEETALFAELRKQLPFVNMAMVQFVLEAAMMESKSKSELFLDCLKIDPVSKSARSSCLLFSSTHDSPPLQNWLEVLTESQKKMLSSITNIPVAVLNCSVGGRYLLFWLLDSFSWLRQRNNRTCFSHVDTTTLTGAALCASPTCLEPMSSFCIQLQDLLSLPDRINVPGQISGDDLWSWRLPLADWRTLTSQPFMHALAQKIAS